MYQVCKACFYCVIWQGVYFADCFTKSRNYCYNAVGSCKVMLLCQVSLLPDLFDFRNVGLQSAQSSTDRKKYIAQSAEILAAQ